MCISDGPSSFGGGCGILGAGTRNNVALAFVEFDGRLRIAIKEADVEVTKFGVEKGST